MAAGHAGLEHRIGGLEKEDVTGAVSYDAANHQQMVDLRAEKIAGIARDIPPAEIVGPAEGELLVVGWGSTYGAVAAAVEEVQQAGRSRGPPAPPLPESLPRQPGPVLARYTQVLVAGEQHGAASLDAARPLPGGRRRAVQGGRPAVPIREVRKKIEACWERRKP